MVIIDLSGFSNLTYTISSVKDVDKKIIVRFFVNASSDFEVENTIFKMMGDKGLGPLEYEANATHRVEEYVHGKVLTMLELRHPFIQKMVVEGICDINNDPEMNEKIRHLRGHDMNFSLAFLED